MTLKKWALIAEIGSAAAVVVTLALLILQVRENTQATQIATYAAISGELNALDLLVAADPELASLFWNKEPGRSELEEQRNLSLLRAAMRAFESAYFAYTGGSLNDGQWQRFERNVCGAWLSLSANQQGDFSYNLTEEFVRHLELHCGRYAAE